MNKLARFVRPEGITVEEFLAEAGEHLGIGGVEDFLRELEAAYEGTWQREKLLYADGYIKLLTSIAEYYRKKHEESNKDERKRLLNELMEAFGDFTYKKRAAEYYINAASVATSVSLIYFPQQNYPEEAERYLKLAVELEERAMELGVVPRYYAIALNNLGTHYYETNRSEEALPVLKKALEYAENPKERGLVLHNLSLTYADLGMKKEAVNCMVKSICIHYSTQHEFGDVSLYDKDINQVVEMTGDAGTDIFALEIALDLIGGNLSAERAKKLLEQIDRDEWPLTNALLSILNGREPALSNEIVGCEKLLKDVAKAVGNKNIAELDRKRRQQHPSQEDIWKRWIDSLEELGLYSKEEL
ncbi:tetratricopeptide repeat protein [Thermococcus sp. 21S7]|uniref:tetratricopeptide repeat protein n=1 Tax=Thermococcus sp. 21S7 TaxID=1638221 RepID=UPI00143B7DC5|nr:tetratricopeptide repeat protein [Thermococcus sp. 21S7]NJE60384.1 tetratricopeptide repeat protein [Thermococcus sp. 21S7]